MKRKIAAILAADVVGYSRMVAEDEEDTLARLCSYRAVFADFIDRFRGRIFNTAGDAILAEFESAVDAVRCAVDIQETLRARNLAYPTSRQMKFRVGITIGDVVERDGDLLGDGVNVAARLESLAPEGGICISRSVHEAVANKLSVEFADKGKQNLKNIPDPVHAYTFASEGSSPRRKSAHLQARFPRYWGGIAALLMLAAGISGFLFFARRESGRPPEPPPVQEAKSDSKVASNEPASISKAAAIDVASSSKVASTDAAGSSKVAAADIATSSSKSAAVQQPPAEDVTDGNGRASSDSNSKPYQEPSHLPISDPLALQATLTRQWNDCRAKDDFEKILKSCSALIDSKIYAGAELASVYLELGRAQRDSKQADEAIQTYTEAIRLAPSARAYNNRGIVYFDKGQWNMAIDDYTEAIRLDPQYGEAFNNRAWTKVKAGRAVVALDDANEAVRLLPTKAYALDTRAHVYEALGDRNAAIRDYRKALELAPDSKGSLQGLKRLGSAL